MSRQVACCGDKRGLPALVPLSIGMVSVLLQTTRLCACVNGDQNPDLTVVYVYQDLNLTFVNGNQNLDESVVNGDQDPE